MVSIENLGVEFSSKPLFTDVSFVINPRDRIALVGKNGAGKTTLLRIIRGEERPTSGVVAKDKDMVIGYLPQGVQISAKTEEGAGTIQDLIDCVSDPQEKAELDRMFIGLGFKRHEFLKPLNTFSGGWRMRVELARILQKKPDLLLLDEPTNHLDIGSINWLEQYIEHSSRTVMVVSHDRTFINNITNRTIEITCGRINDYKVKYDEYVKLRDERHEHQIRAYENQQKEIAEIKEFVERFRYKPTKSNQVQSRLKQLEKIVPIEIDDIDTSMLHLKFPPCERSGDYPIICEEVAKSYPTADDETCLHTVFSGVNLTIKRGEKVAFMGNNGEGKTTLVKCIMNEIPFEGHLKIGHNVQIGYFAQNQAQLLDGNMTVFDTIDRVARGNIRTKIRDILGAFMFGGEASEKFVKVLSGGEKSRLAMIKLLLEPVNLLILDEPTNHLDMQSKDVLKDAIKAFDGTAIIVSHDRYFLNGLVDKVYEFADGKVREVIEHSTLGVQSNNKKVNTIASPSNTTSVQQKDSKEDYEHQKAEARRKANAERKLKLCEEKVAALEAEIAEIETILSEKNDMQMVEKYTQLKAELDREMEHWMELSE
ncbi:MAG: ABC-F family ATP-binding cassette domain-containing protein [Prevotellaceae bacterium]|nr:ABC-F family ATP-binding cassette domain-containing protein [Candidatus Colivivens equi]